MNPDGVLAHLRRFGIAILCGLLGLHPEQLALADTMAAARAWAAPVARWGHRHLSWPPRGRGLRAGDVGPTIGRKVALWR
jgi:hypothetical protein